MFRSFSPLRYWGGLYQNIDVKKHTEIVLVPFDIGVVYISSQVFAFMLFSFSPLRYWGGLYLPLSPSKSPYLVLVPFDIGVVYIPSFVFSDRIF